MDFEFRDGKCIVMKKEMKNCLVLPKGTYSAFRDVLLSKEGFEKIKKFANKENTKSGKCFINGQNYDNCYIIPMGVLFPKIPVLLSHSALSGIGAAMAKRPEGEVVEQLTKEPNVTEKDNAPTLEETDIPPDGTTPSDDAEVVENPDAKETDGTTPSDDTEVVEDLDAEEVETEASTEEITEEQEKTDAS